MDLSGLSNNLPSAGGAGSSTNNTSIDLLNHEISLEFKNAAKSVAALYASKSLKLSKTEFTSAAKLVASLYRLTVAGNAHMQTKGYVSCLDDILLVMASGGDVENWLLTRRAEIMNANPQLDQASQINPRQESIHTSINTNPNINPSTTSNFNLNSDGQDPHVGDSFQSMPLLSPPISNRDFEFPEDAEFSFTHDLSPQHHFRPLFPPLLVLHLLKQKQRIRRERTARKYKLLLLLELSEESEIEERSEKRRKL